MVYVPAKGGWEEKLIENKINLFGSYSNGNLIITFTLDYAYPEDSNDNLTIQFMGTNISSISFEKGTITKSYTFSGIPSQVYITSISPSKDSIYKYVAGDPWKLPLTKTAVKLNASAQAGIGLNPITIIYRSNGIKVTSDLSFVTNLKINYSDGTSAENIEAFGSMKAGETLDKTTCPLLPPAGTTIRSVTVISSTVSPTSDPSHTYSF